MARFVYPMMQDAFVKFYNLAKESDKVLFHVKTLADNFADQFPDKMIKADVFPPQSLQVTFQISIRGMPIVICESTNI